MIHFGFPKPTINIQKPYFDDVWIEKKLKQKFDKIFFSILDYELNDKFYTKEMKSNLFDKALPIGFKTTLKRWVEALFQKELQHSPFFWTPIICMTWSMTW
jgi:hypothetical protein